MDKLKEDIKAQLEYSNALRKDCDYINKLVEEQITAEQSELFKLKQTTKGTVNRELMRLRDFNAAADYEFRRVNNFMKSTSTIVNCLLEDSMMQ